MLTGFDKQRSSRPTITTTSTVNMTKAGPQTYQLRIAATALATGHLIVADSSSTGVAVLIPIGAAIRGEYITITPGQWYLPAPSMFVTEMS